MVAGKKTNVTRKSFAWAIFQFAIEINSSNLFLSYNTDCALPDIAL